MRNRSSKVKCIKKKFDKCADICRCYSDLQSAYADFLQSNPDISEIRCNVLLTDFPIEGEYTTDFVCIKQNGDLLVRECVWRSLITKPMTVKLLDASRVYWTRRGVLDWGIVVDEK